MCFFKLEVIVVDVRGLCFVCLSLLFLCACVSHCFDLVLSSHFAFASICGLNVIIGYLIWTNFFLDLATFEYFCGMFTFQSKISTIFVAFV